MNTQVQQAQQAVCPVTGLVKRRYTIVHYEDRLALLKKVQTGQRFVGFTKPEDEKNRTYDYNKVNSELVGKTIKVEYYTTEYDPDIKMNSGCYKTFQGKCIEVCLITNVGLCMVFDNGVEYAVHKLHDFSITEL